MTDPTMPANAPEAGSNGEREALLDAICDGIWFASDKRILVCRQWVDEALKHERFTTNWTIAPAAGFTRAQHGAMMADKRRDTVECYVCFGNGATAFNNGHTAKCRACDGNGRLNVDAVRELVEDQYRAHKDTIAMVQAKATEALANNETIKAGYAALRAERDALAAKLDGYKEALDLRAMAFDMKDKAYRAAESRAAALAEALREIVAMHSDTITIGKRSILDVARAALAGNGNCNGTGEG